MTGLMVAAAVCVLLSAATAFGQAQTEREAEPAVREIERAVDHNRQPTR